MKSQRYLTPGFMTHESDRNEDAPWGIFGGMPGRNGISAATMVQAGYTGVLDVFDGQGNFLVAYAEQPRPEQFVAELGSRFEVMLTNIKKYCVGFPIQSATSIVKKSDASRNRSTVPRLMWSAST